MGTVPTPAALERFHHLVPSADADSEGATTDFHITGFARFHNVPVNPTELIVRALPTHLAMHPPKPRANLASARVLKVAAKATAAELHGMYAALPAARPSRRTVFIHLGVNVSLARFELEVQARNEATFLCPDEAGWTPMNRPIDLANPDLAATERTTLKLQPLVDDLRRKGYGVDLSTDAGRFVCNWVYFNSLQMAKRNDAIALFVHVPSASVVPIERQTQFLAALLDSIASML